MISQAADTSVRMQIVVSAPIERAFKVFVEDFDRIKPREHNLLGVEIAETVFEPHVGGNIYDRGVDGSECRWARVLAFEPPSRIVISWDIDPQWQIETDPDKASEVEIRFISETPERTRREAALPRRASGGGLSPSRADSSRARSCHSGLAARW